jgi:hypothetical protein
MNYLYEENRGIFFNFAKYDICGNIVKRVKVRIHSHILFKNSTKGQISLSQNVIKKTSSEECLTDSHDKDKGNYPCPP